MRHSFFASFALLAALVLACGQNSPVGPDVTSEEERIIRQIQGSGIQECLAEFQRVFPTLQNLTEAERLAELRRILALCFAPSPGDGGDGSLQVTTSTTGEQLDPDGYTVAVSGQTSQSIGTNGTVTFSGLASGNFQVELQGVAANCTVAGSNPRTVSVPTWGPGSTTFNVSCTATTGDLEVTTSTTGDDLDPDGYTVAVQGQTSQAVGINGTVTFAGIPAGDHQVELQGVAGNCTVTGDNPRTVNVPAGGTGSTTFDVTCSTIPAETGNLDVTAATTGDNLDPDGYTVAVQGQTSQAIGINGMVTFSNLPAGDHQVELQGVAANCTVGGDNPRTVNVPAGGTGSTTFNVTCTADGGGGPSGIIAFVSRATTNDNNEIWVMNADGSNPTQLTNNQFHEIQPRISTDGQRIVFASDADGDREIFIMNVDGTGITQLTNNTVRDQEPRLSPDGTQIVFERLVSGFDQVFVMDVDGSNQTQLTFEDANSGEPGWSPDGTQIVFTSNRMGGAEIWVMDADGSNPVRLTSSTGANGDAVWFGTQIVFESSRTGNFEIFVMNDDGTGQTQLTNVPGVASQDPTWSPDGTMIGFDRSEDIHTMNADGTNVTNITNSTALDQNPSWGPGSI